MIFSIMLNFAVGIMSTAVVDIEDNPVFNNSASRMGLYYDEDYSNEFNSELNQSLNPNAELEDAGDQIYRVLDMIGLGFIKRILNTIDKYMFGFVNLLEMLIGGMMGEASRTLIFGIMKSIITIGYIIGAWMLWTGKSL